MKVCVIKPPTVTYRDVNHLSIADTSSIPYPHPLQVGMQNLSKIHLVIQCSILCRMTTTFDQLIGPNLYLHANEQRNILFLLKTKTHFIAKRWSLSIGELIDLIGRLVRYINLDRARTVCTAGGKRNEPRCIAAKWLMQLRVETPKAKIVFSLFNN